MPQQEPITPGQVKKLLHQFMPLRKALRQYFPSGSGGMASTHHDGISCPTERIAVARADLDFILNRVEEAIEDLPKTDRMLIKMHYFEQTRWYHCCQRFNISRSQFYRTLDRIANVLAVALGEVGMESWRSFRRGVRMFLGE